MPSRTKDGRPVGGAEKARRKKALAEAERRRSSVAPGLSSIQAPPENTAGLVRWGAQVLAAVMHRATQEGSIFETERDQLRFIAECCAKLGMIRDKAAEQEVINQRLAELNSEQSKTSGLEPVNGLKSPKVPRASGGASRRRAETLP